MRLRRAHCTPHCLALFSYVLYSMRNARQPSQPFGAGRMIFGLPPRSLSLSAKSVRTSSSAKSVRTDFALKLELQGEGSGGEERRAARPSDVQRIRTPRRQPRAGEPNEREGRPSDTQWIQTPQRPPRAREPNERRAARPSNVQCSLDLCTYTYLGGVPRTLQTTGGCGRNLGQLRRS